MVDAEGGPSAGPGCPERGGRCPSPGNLHGRVGRGSEQADVVEDGETPRCGEVVVGGVGLDSVTFKYPFRPKAFSDSMSHESVRSSSSGHFPRSAIPEGSRAAFASAKGLGSPPPSAVSATRGVGLPAAPFRLRCSPTRRRDPSVKRAYRVSFSGDLRCGGAPSARVASSGDAPKFRPSGLPAIPSGIPGSFPIGARRVTRRGDLPFERPAPLQAVLLLDRSIRAGLTIGP